MFKIGEGLTITEDGTLSVNGGSVSPDCVTDVSLKEDAPGVIIVSKADETKELDVFQYMIDIEVYCIEDSI